MQKLITKKRKLKDNIKKKIVKTYVTAYFWTNLWSLRAMHKSTRGRSITSYEEYIVDVVCQR